MKYRDEKELANQVIDFIKNEWEIYPEVCLKDFKRIDIIAKKNNELWAIECKLSLNLKLLEQAYSRLQYCQYVSIAIPSNKKIQSMTKHILDSLGIGIIFVNDNPHEIKPKYNNCSKELNTWLNSSLSKFHTLFEAGSSNKYLSPLKSIDLRIAEKLKDIGGTSDLFSVVCSIVHHYKTNRLAYKHILNYYSEGKFMFFEHKDSKWITKI